MFFRLTLGNESSFKKESAYNHQRRICEKRMKQENIFRNSAATADLDSKVLDLVLKPVLGK